MKIGIGITTRNRRSVFQETLAKMRALMPPDARLVIVDDASTEPLTAADYRFKSNAGIARGKNKCLELLEDCDHIFLFDDDTYPLCDEWWKPYVESDQSHLMYLFGKLANGHVIRDGVKFYQDSKHQAWSHPRGCMLYFKRDAIDTVGGFDPAFGTWGWEHVNLSDRIYNAGLTDWPYQDVVGSDKLIFNGDEAVTVTSTVDPKGPRIEHMARSTKVYHELHAKRPYFVDYKEGNGLDAVITSYFVGALDPQRDKKWEPNLDEIEILRKSVRLKATNALFAVMNDCFPENIFYGYERVEITDISPYWQRWVSAYQWLQRHPEVGNVWCVDATDVELLRSPFESMKPGVIYVGHEATTTAIPWMFNMHKAKFLQDFFRRNAATPLLNAGILGGNRVDIMDFIRVMLTRWAKNNADVIYAKDQTVGATDMGLFNWTCRENFAHRIEHGPHVVTKFKAYADNGIAWWRHK